MSKIGPATVKTIQGESIVIGEKEFTPVARVVSLVRRSATVEEKTITGGGGGFVRIEPVAILETTPGGTRRLPVRDETRRGLMGMLAVALALPILLELAARLIERRRRLP